jgi:hypothetical protein
VIDRDTVISIHEAGHAVIARALALRCGAATMADGRGRADYQDDEAEDGSIATIVAHMAGAAAEYVLTGRIANGLASDQEQVTSLCDARDMTQDAVDRLWSTACALVRANETAIRVVAVALQRRGELSGREIDALLTSGSM